MKGARSKPILFVLGFYAVCWVIRIVEYFVFRTDQTIIGEAVIHKSAGIVLLAVALGVVGYKWRDVGFCSNKFIRDTGKGLLLGIGAFVLAYGVEMIIQTAAGNAPALDVHVTSYAIVGNRSLEGGFWILVFCIVGNVINVVMEEGVFRGLFCKLPLEKHAFWLACILSSLLFGFWHIAQPIRNIIDGEQTFGGAVMFATMLVITSTLLAIQYCMLNRVTGSIWAGMAAHFVNNITINLLHVSTVSGVDEMQTTRIAIAQAVSFVVVLIIYLADRRKKAKNQTAGSAV